MPLGADGAAPQLSTARTNGQLPRCHPFPLPRPERAFSRGCAKAVRAPERWLARKAERRRSHRASVHAPETKRPHGESQKRARSAGAGLTRRFRRDGHAPTRPVWPAFPEDQWSLAREKSNKTGKYRQTSPEWHSPSVTRSAEATCLRERLVMLTAQPLVAVSGDEGVVVQVRVGGVNAVNFLDLAGAENFARVQAPGALK